jgi:hypothetical protein
MLLQDELRFFADQPDRGDRSDAEKVIALPSKKTLEPDSAQSSYRELP